MNFQRVVRNRETRIFLEFERYKTKKGTPGLENLKILERLGYIDENQGGSDLVVNGVATSYDWTLKGMHRLRELKRH